LGFLIKTKVEKKSPFQDGGKKKRFRVNPSKHI
jgi:hypothetical protein